MPAARQGCVAVDLGKTKVRLRGYGTALPVDCVDAGAPGLADTGGAAAALASIVKATAALHEDAVAGVASWSVGAAGSESAPDASAKLAHDLRDTLGAPVAVTSDVVTAHVGATGGRPGTLLIAGTGAVALRIGLDGRITRSDGWGPWLGDEGSGRWIGQYGLHAALRAADGRGPRTDLVEDAQAFCDGGIPALPRAVSGPCAATRLAAFAPAVLSRAANGDTVAADIVRNAVAALATTALSVRSADDGIYLAGGLGQNTLFRTELRTALAAQGLRLKDPAGDALDGAAILAAHTDLPHERLVIRV